MVRLWLLFGPLVLVLCVFCVIHVIVSREEDVRHLPKWAWLILVLLFPLVGSIAWLAVGRPGSGPRRLGPYERSADAFPEYDRPGRAAALSAEDDEEFLRRCRERAEEQRRTYQEQRRAESASADDAEDDAAGDDATPQPGAEAVDPDSEPDGTR